MKRYLKLITIAVIITISIGIFYTKAAKNTPRLYLKTEKGNSSYTKDLVIHGWYSGRSVDFISSGEDYYKSNSILCSVFGDDFDLKELNELKSEAKNYMRGKYASRNFYVDKDVVWYASVNEQKNSNFKLYIDGLERQSKERATFEIDIPNNDKASYIDVNDVQLVGNELAIVTYQNATSSEDYVDQEKQIMYRIDVKEKRLIDSKEISISDSSSEDNVYTHQYVIENSDVIGPNVYYVYRDEQLKNIVQPDGTVIEEEIRKDLKIFNLATNKEESLNISKEQQKIVKNSEIFFDKDILYFLTQKDEEISILKYNLEDKKVEGEPFVITGIDSVEYLIYSVNDSKLYLLSGPTSIVIVDLLAGEKVFEGSISAKDAHGKDAALSGELEIYHFTNQ